MQTSRTNSLILNNNANEETFKSQFNRFFRSTKYRASDKRHEISTKKNSNFDYFWPSFNNFISVDFSQKAYLNSKFIKM